MNVEKQPFRQYNLNDEKDNKRTIISVSLNNEELQRLKEAGELLEQKKDSTILKTLAEIGYANVIHDKSTRLIIDTIFKNKQLNRRSGWD